MKRTLVQRRSANNLADIARAAEANSGYLNPLDWDEFEFAEEFWFCPDEAREFDQRMIDNMRRTPRFQGVRVAMMALSFFILPLAILAGIGVAGAESADVQISPNAHIAAEGFEGLPFQYTETIADQPEGDYTGLVCTGDDRSPGQEDETAHVYIATKQVATTSVLPVDGSVQCVEFTFTAELDFNTVNFVHTRDDGDLYPNSFFVTYLELTRSIPEPEPEPEPTTTQAPTTEAPTTTAAPTTAPTTAPPTTQAPVTTVKLATPVSTIKPKPAPTTAKPVPTTAKPAPKPPKTMATMQPKAPTTAAPTTVEPTPTTVVVQPIRRLPETGANTTVNLALIGSALLMLGAATLAGRKAVQS